MCCFAVLGRWWASLATGSGRWDGLRIGLREGGEVGVRGRGGAWGGLEGRGGALDVVACAVAGRR